MKRSLILGGTKGLGLALAKESAERDIQPIVTGRSVEEPNIKASLPENAIRIAMDLTDDESIDKAMSVLEYDAIDYFFWNAGTWPGRKSFRELSPADIDNITATNFTGPLKVLHRFHEKRELQKKPYHLIAISSASAWLIRKNETVYCASKDAQAVFVLNFADELALELPGSHATIFYPGGMKTEIFKDTKQDTTGYMEPLEVAKAVWNEVLNQKEVCREVHIIRNKEKNDGSFTLEYGPKLRGIK
ncbi:MAG: SDR family oxidoreductase [Candidatus Liptonbacteria bacterium]|nr:SDR family oxidoreductase [Candidatus Liptonbacteria bacterium]